MSLKAARAYIDKAIRSTPEYSNISSMRQAMRTKLHSLNVSYSTFETNNSKSINKLSPSDLKYFYSIFIVTLKNAIGRNRVYTSLTQAEPILSKEELLKSVSGCILITAGINTSIIGYDYDAIRRLLSLVLKSNQQLRESPLGAEYLGTSPITGAISYKSLLELGHTLTDTPFAETIKSVLTYSTNATLNTDLNNILDKLYTTQASVGYEFLNKSDNSKPGAGIISLVIQPKDINRALSKEEGKLYRSFLNSVVASLNLSEIPGSNTLKQDAIQFYEDYVLSAVTGKKRANIKKHGPVKGSVKVGKDSKNKVSSFKNTDLVKVKDFVTVNLVSLQNLINRQLQDVISANMGDGNSRNVLNYRTGRLASSAKVESMSQSRAGMITAFYSYMRNPYATFSEGGRQSSPRSRDPKLLISKSIREIAATQVANQLRAVNV